MRTEDLHYDLPPELIAQAPATPRDASRLLVVDRAAATRAHRRFRDLPEYLRAGDALVLNDTRVLKARFFARRSTGGRIEALFLHADADGWRVLLKPSAKLRVGETLACEGTDAGLALAARRERGEWLARPEPPTDPLTLLEKIGAPPLPPYIARPAGPAADDVARYQTIYADQPGAVAAPTAGLHFTPELFAQLDELGVRRVTLTLHVGLGTFQPIQAAELADHPMHAEQYSISADAIARLDAVRRAGGRIVAVGTTSTRVLESLPLTLGVDDAPATGHSGWTDIFIYPPYQPRNLDMLITNFHLPGSTLLALVMALAGREQTLAAYADAVAQRYRFYSYGDALLLLL